METLILLCTPRRCGSGLIRDYLAGNGIPMRELSHFGVDKAGDIAQAKRFCADYCLTGLCVTVTETEFIYKGGREMGFIVGLVNYPRFPSTPEDILGQAELIAMQLINELAQNKALIQTPTEAVYYERPESSDPRTGEKP